MWKLSEESTWNARNKYTETEVKNAPNCHFNRHDVTGEKNSANVKIDQ